MSHIEELEKAVRNLTKSESEKIKVLLDLRRYLLRGAIQSKDDRNFCIDKINSVLDESDNIDT
jgi:hypothetical protein